MTGTEIDERVDAFIEAAKAWDEAVEEDDFEQELLMEEMRDKAVRVAEAMAEQRDGPSWDA